MKHANMSHDDDPRSGLSDTSASGRERAGDRPATAPFDEPALWRAEIIGEFRLRGEERCAAASPVPGFPQVLRSVLSTMNDVPDGPWLDVGGGLGGVSSWLERSAGADTVVVDREVLSLRAAQQLFPTLRTAAADVSAMPLRSQSAAVVIISGVVSLLDDLDPLVSETQRILAPGGAVVVTDLWSTGPSSFQRDPNVFWSIEELSAAAVRRGLVRTHVAIADPSTGWWSRASQQVADEIDQRYSDREAYRQWRRDRDHLIEVIESGCVTPAGVVFRPEGTDAD